MGGSKGRGNDISALMPFANQFNAETQPLVKEQLTQAMEALQTGGVGARIPLIQSAQAQSQNALSNSLMGIREQASATGMSNSPFTLGALGRTSVEGRQQIAGIGPQLAGEAAQGGGGIFQAIMGALAGSRTGHTASKSGGF